MLGRTVSHYRVLEKLGGGGMGEVYRAHDERLDRDVALKVLPAGTLADETARRRFRKEALTLSQLNHPNIAVVHDFDTQEGVDFLAMEYVAGETLAQKLAAGPLPEKEVLALATQIAEALEEAHERDIIHRDLKPGNVMVTVKERVKVLDFGLAKLVRPAEEDGATASLGETQAGAVMGTVPYMAPEQLQGHPVDARADVYALGAVLYEMATGQRPFPEKRSTQLISAILTEAPQPPREVKAQISPGLEAITLKALEKDPARRYQSARDLLADLRELSLTGSVAVARRRALTRRGVLAAAGSLVAFIVVLVGLKLGGWRERLLGRGGPPRIQSLAILPLENLSGDLQQAYFADGMTEALINDLARTRALKVIARNSVMRYQGSRKPLSEIAKELGVDAVITGSVVRSGSRVRVTAQLIEAKGERSLWADRYEHEMRDVISIQDEFAAAIVREVRVRLTPQEQQRLARQATRVDPEVYDLYLKARYLWNRRSKVEDVKQARTYLEQVIQKDPNYGLGYASLAEVYHSMASWGPKTGLPRLETYVRARATATKALELDDTLAEAHLALAAVKGEWDWDWEGAEREYRRAIELNPNYANAHNWYGEFLSVQGRHEEAIAEAKLAVRLDPFCWVCRVTLGEALFYARRYDEAMQQGRKMIESNPNDAEGYFLLNSCYLEEGKYDEAHALSMRVLSLSGWPKEVIVGLEQAYKTGGRKGEARQTLQDAKRMHYGPFVLAWQYITLGDHDRALEQLEKLVAERRPIALRLKTDPGYDPLRSDPRFQALLRRMNFP